MDASVEKVREAVENYFEIDELKHSPFDDRNVAKTGFAVKTKFGHVELLFHAYDSQLIIHTFIPIQATEDVRAKVAEFVVRANYGLRVGCFDFDFDDGEISYRTSIFCGIEDFSPPTYEQIDHDVCVALAMIRKYGDALVKVMFGLVEPKEAIDAVENADD